MMHDPIGAFMLGIIFSGLPLVFVDQAVFDIDVLPDSIPISVMVGFGIAAAVWTWRRNSEVPS